MLLERLEIFKFVFWLPGISVVVCILWLLSFVLAERT
jgi:hypothetical protein